MPHMIVEQTKQYAKRMKYQPETNTFYETDHYSRGYEKGIRFPYGWLKESGTPPQDHLDVVLLADIDCDLGDEIEIRVIGVFLRCDGDNKLLAVPPAYAAADLGDLSEEEKADLHRLYAGKYPGEGWCGRAEAEKIIAQFKKVHAAS